MSMGRKEATAHGRKIAPTASGGEHPLQGEGSTHCKGRGEPIARGREHPLQGEESIGGGN